MKADLGHSCPHTGRNNSLGSQLLPSRTWGCCGVSFHFQRRHAIRAPQHPAAWRGAGDTLKMHRRVPNERQKISSCPSPTLHKASLEDIPWPSTLLFGCEARASWVFYPHPLPCLLPFPLALVALGSYLPTKPQHVGLASDSHFLGNPGWSPYSGGRPNMSFNDLWEISERERGSKASYLGLAQCDFAAGRQTRVCPWRCSSRAFVWPRPRSSALGAQSRRIRWVPECACIHEPCLNQELI